MAKLWAKGYELDEEMEAFTVGKDYILDRELVEADVLAVSYTHLTLPTKA